MLLARTGHSFLLVLKEINIISTLGYQHTDIRNDDFMIKQKHFMEVQFA
jgi:hypothetical protein